MGSEAVAISCCAAWFPGEPPREFPLWPWVPVGLEHEPRLSVRSYGFSLNGWIPWVAADSQRNYLFKRGLSYKLHGTR